MLRFSNSDLIGDGIKKSGGFFGDNINSVLREMRDNVNVEYEGVFKKMERHLSAYTAMM